MVDQKTGKVSLCLFFLTVIVFSATASETDGSNEDAVDVVSHYKPYNSSYDTNMENTRQKRVLGVIFDYYSDSNYSESDSDEQPPPAAAAVVAVNQPPPKPVLKPSQRTGPTRPAVIALPYPAPTPAPPGSYSCPPCAPCVCAREQHNADSNNNQANEHHPQARAFDLSSLIDNTGRERNYYQKQIRRVQHQTTYHAPTIQRPKYTYYEYPSEEKTKTVYHYPQTRAFTLGSLIDNSGRVHNSYNQKQNRHRLHQATYHPPTIQRPNYNTYYEYPEEKTKTFYYYP